MSQHDLRTTIIIIDICPYMSRYYPLKYHVSACFRTILNCETIKTHVLATRPRHHPSRLRRGIGIFGVLVRVVDQRQAPVGFADLTWF
jgi:hypothetical protein